MEYPQITSLVPTGEHFDLSAMNGGIWLTEGHVTAIEQSLVNAAANLTASNAATEQVRQELATAQQSANTAATEASNTISGLNATITDLQKQVSTLKGSPAKEFTATVATADPALGNAKPVPAHDDANSSYNKLVDSLTFPKK